MLAWSRAFLIDDGEGNQTPVPREPLHWIKVTAVARRARGGWVVRFDVVDHRSRRRLVRARTPKYTAEVMREDLTRPPGESEKDLAREQSHYTSNVASAVDHLEAVPRDHVPPDQAQLHRRQKQALRERAPSSIGAQLDAMLADARTGQIDVHNRLGKIKRELRLLERDLSERAA